jgi:hypothetical protein
MIHFLPIKSYGFADLETKDIYLNNNLSLNDLKNTLIHEIGHLIRGNPDHNKKWFDACHYLYPSFLYTFDVGNINIGNIAGNVGNVTGIQNLLLDYNLLLQYRKFSQRLLGTEGQWEVKGDNKIRLFPTPRGSYPVVVEYYPSVYQFRTPSAREITKRALVAEAKIILGNARSKFSGIPGPDGGTINLNGEALRTEGQVEKKQAVDDAIAHGEPLGPILW